jgi:hypothetical protein
VLLLQEHIVSHVQTLLHVQVSTVLQEQSLTGSGRLLTPTAIVSHTHTIFSDNAVPAGTVMVLQMHTISVPG